MVTIARTKTDIVLYLMRAGDSGGANVRVWLVIVHE